MSADLSSLTSDEAVHLAVKEFREVGRDAFLSKYGFGRSRAYFLVDNDELFDSKAVLGAAFGFQFGTPLSPAEFSGGEKETVRVLTDLGFRVDSVDDWLSLVSVDHVKAELEEFRRVGRAKYLLQYGGGEAAKFVLLDGPDVFDAKAVLVCALRRATGLPGISHRDIEGTEHRVAEPLRRLGWKVSDLAMNESVLSSDDSLRIQALIETILDLQGHYSAELSDPSMVQRRDALVELDALLVEACGPTFGWPGGRTFSLSGDVSKGAGNAPKVAWARLMDAGRSPSATSGWYVVLLFAADGSRCYLSLMPGTSSVTGGDKLERIRFMAGDAFSFLDDSPTEGPGSGWVPFGGVPSGRWNKELDLQGGSLGRTYEVGHVDGVAYEKGKVPAGLEVVNHARALLGMLGRLYEREEGPVDGVVPLHVLLRWSESGAGGFDPLEEHRDVLAARGSVIWAKFGRPLNPPKVKLLQGQIDTGIPTYAYLLGGNPSVLVRATISEVHSGLASVDSSLIPEYYRASLDGAETCFVLSEIGVVDLFSQLDDVLQLATRPDGLLSKSLVSQNTLFYVQERSPQSASVKSAETSNSRIAEVAERLNMSSEQISELLRGVSGSKRQMILMGPPGTGKTFVAQELASLLVDDPSCVRLVQFHPSYGYEDFIEGLRPFPSPHGGFEFRRFPGVLVEMCEGIAQDGETRVLIIDEINRANISKVFGELMFLLEYRDKTMRLMLDGRDFALPDELIIIGTMNTADRSIRTLDVAMRRRFRFFELPPSANVISGQYSKPGWVNSVGAALIAGFERLNNQLQLDIDRHHTIGHSYFLNTTMTPEHLRDVWRHEIFPLIEDYFFDRPDKADEYTFDSFWPDV